MHRLSILTPIVALHLAACTSTSEPATTAAVLDGNTLVMDNEGVLCAYRK